ncbi:MAG: sulfatase [Alloprevotella sp.]|nr:sulfatase [Alloprevotella sp.]
MKQTYGKMAAVLSLLPIAASAQRYNVVYIMTDDHTAQMMSCYDRSHIQTPNLDRIAENGLRFTQSYVANSLSGPSRACMITGKHSHNNGFTNNEHGIFDGSQQTMPKLLQQAGYETALIGKWHLVSDPTGFDFWNIVPGQGDYYNPPFINMDGTTSTEKGYLTNIITDKAIDWLENKRDKEKPFLILVHHKAIHRDWLPEIKYLHEYEDQEFQLPDTFYDDFDGRRAAQTQEMHIAKDMDLVYDTKMYQPYEHTRLSEHYKNMVTRLDGRDQLAYSFFYDSLTVDFLNRFPDFHELQNELETQKPSQYSERARALAEFKYQRYMRDYAKVVKTLDDNVGRLLDYLENAGLTDSTLIVYTSDQGFYMGEHGWFDKRFMYQESFATPLVMQLPRTLQKEREANLHDKGDDGLIHEMVQNIDYAPTFLELAGAQVPADMDGVSLLPLLKGEHPKNWRHSLYYHYYEFPAEHSVKRHYGVFDGRYKLIHFYQDIDAWELYDLQADPHELHNIYGQPGTEKATRRMRKELKRLQLQYHDPILNDFTL